MEKINTYQKFRRLVVEESILEGRSLEGQDNSVIDAEVMSCYSFIQAEVVLDQFWTSDVMNIFLTGIKPASPTVIKKWLKDYYDDNMIQEDIDNVETYLRQNVRKYFKFKIMQSQH